MNFHSLRKRKKLAIKKREKKSDAATPECTITTYDNATNNNNNRSDHTLNGTRSVEEKSERQSEREMMCLFLDRLIFYFKSLQRTILFLFYEHTHTSGSYM